MATAAYVRVSSRAQNHATQKAAIERAAKARGHSIDGWYSEKRSGKGLARPQLDRLRRDVRAGKVNRLYVYRLDRLTRSGIRDTFELIEELRRNGCPQILSVADGFDLDGPAAEIILAVMAWSAKMERLAINERIAAARDRLEREGRRWGRPPRMDESLADRAYQLREEGKSIRAIAAALQVPKSTIARTLSVSQKVAPARAS